MEQNLLSDLTQRTYFVWRDERRKLSKMQSRLFPVLRSVFNVQASKENDAFLLWESGVRLDLMRNGYHTGNAELDDDTNELSGVQYLSGGKKGWNAQNSPAFIVSFKEADGQVWAVNEFGMTLKERGAPVTVTQ